MKTIVTLKAFAYVVGLRKQLAPGTYEFDGDLSHSFGSSSDAALMGVGALIVEIVDGVELAIEGVPAPAPVVEEAKPVVDEVKPTDPIVVEDLPADAAAEDVIDEVAAEDK